MDCITISIILGGLPNKLLLGSNPTQDQISWYNNLSRFYRLAAEVFVHRTLMTVGGIHEYSDEVVYFKNGDPEGYKVMGKFSDYLSSTLSLITATSHQFLPKINCQTPLGAFVFWLESLAEEQVLASQRTFESSLSSLEKKNSRLVKIQNQTERNTVENRFVENFYKEYSKKRGIPVPEPSTRFLLILAMTAQELAKTDVDVDECLRRYEKASAAYYRAAYKYAKASGVTGIAWRGGKRLYGKKHGGTYR